jgi:Cu+-exporting ATPase
MTCAACVNTIESVVGSEKGIKSISVNLSTNTAKVKFDGDLTGPRDIIAMIEDVQKLLFSF